MEMIHSSLETKILSTSLDQKLSKDSKFIQKKSQRKRSRSLIQKKIYLAKKTF